MDEEEFNALVKPKPFDTMNAGRVELLIRRRTSLALILWGKTSDDLQSQLLATTPEIPSGFDLTDFRELLRFTTEISAAVGRTPSGPEAVVVGAERYTEWEARCEIIRRAIQYLENR